MSIAELKAAADRLSPEERQWLRAYLAALDRVQDQAYLAEVTRRNDGLASGQGVVREDVLRAAEEADRRGGG